MVGGGGWSTAGGCYGGRAVVQSHGSSSTVPQIEGFKAQKHHLGMEKAGVGQVGAEEVGKTARVMEVVESGERRLGKTTIPMRFLHGASWD